MRKERKIIAKTSKIIRIYTEGVDSFYIIASRYRIWEKMQCTHTQLQLFNITISTFRKLVNYDNY